MLAAALSAEVVSIDVVLDAEDILTQIQAHNSALLTYLTDHTVLAAMLQRLIPSTSEGTSESLACRIPFHAAEILSGDYPRIHGELASDPALLTTLFGMLPIEGALQYPVVAMYCTQVLDRITTHHSEQIRTFASTSPTAMLALVHNLHITCVKDFLLFLLGMTGPDEIEAEATALCDALCAAGLGDKLVERILRAEDPEECVTCLPILIDIIARYEHGPTTALRQYLLSQSVLERVWTTLAQSPPSIRFPAACSYFTTVVESVTNARDVLEQPAGVLSLIASCPALFGVLRSLLTQPIKCNPPITLPDRSLRLRLSPSHLTAVELLTALVDALIPEIGDSIATSGLIPPVLVLGNTFILHSVLQSAINKLLLSVMHRKSNVTLAQSLFAVDKPEQNIAKYVARASTSAQVRNHYLPIVQKINSIVTAEAHPLQPAVEECLNNMKDEWAAQTSALEVVIQDRERKLWLKPLQDEKEKST